MLYIDGIIYSLQSSGGISIYFSEIIKRLELSGKKFNVCNVGMGNHILEEYHLTKYCDRNNHFSKINRYLDVGIGKEFDVFHSSYYRLPIRRKNIKIITTVHDFTYEKFSSGLKKKIHSLQKNRAIINSDVIVCISESTKNDLLTYCPEAKEKNIKVIYNGVSNDFFNLETDKFHENVILFVGGRSGYKNFFAVVDAVSELPDYRLLFVGGGSISPEEEIYLNKKIKGRFKHITFVSNNELNVLYNKVTCLVYPSLYEGFGIPPIEAMKSHCPVIVSRTSSLPEVCNDACLYLKTNDGEGILNAVRALENNELKNNLIDKGHENAKRFDWNETFNQLEKVYWE